MAQVERPGVKRAVHRHVLQGPPIGGQAAHPHFEVRVEIVKRLGRRPHSSHIHGLGHLRLRRFRSRCARSSSRRRPSRRGAAAVRIGIQVQRIDNQVRAERRPGPQRHRHAALYLGAIPRQVDGAQRHLGRVGRNLGLQHHAFQATGNSVGHLHTQPIRESFRVGADEFQIAAEIRFTRFGFDEAEQRDIGHARRLQLKLAQRQLAVGQLDIQSHVVDHPPLEGHGVNGQRHHTVHVFGQGKTSVRLSLRFLATAYGLRRCHRILACAGGRRGRRPHVAQQSIDIDTLGFEFNVEANALCQRDFSLTGDAHCAERKSQFAQRHILGRGIDLGIQAKGLTHRRRRAVAPRHGVQQRRQVRPFDLRLAFEAGGGFDFECSAIDLRTSTARRFDQGSDGDGAAFDDLPQGCFKRQRHAAQSDFALSLERALQGGGAQRRGQAFDPFHRTFGDVLIDYRGIHDFKMIEPHAQPRTALAIAIAHRCRGGGCCCGFCRSRLKFQVGAPVGISLDIDLRLHQANAFHLHLTRQQRQQRHADFNRFQLGHLRRNAACGIAKLHPPGRQRRRG